MPPEIFVYKITRSSVDKLDFDLPDFDSITTALPAGLYTTFRTYAERTKVIGLRSHLDRLYIPAKHGKERTHGRGVGKLEARSPLWIILFQHLR